MSRSRYTIAACVATTAIAIASFAHLPTKLVWNASASAPIGLYDLNPPRNLEVGDLVVTMPPKPLADFMVGRGYIGRNVPLLKHIAAIAGQKVCRSGLDITVDGALYGDALERDRRGRKLPIWEGCHRLGEHEIFLMNPSVRDSLDGRYFGPLSARAVIGKATPLYTDEAGDGRFVWRAATR